MSPRARAALALLALVTLPAAAVALPAPGSTQPDRLPLGTAYAGSTVEASFLVYEAGVTAEGVEFKVEAPKWVKVLGTKKEVRTVGDASYVTGIVTLAIDTEKPGTCEGKVKVTLGRQEVAVPVTAVVKPRRDGLVRTLVVESPFQCYSTDNADLFGAWTDLVKDSPLDVSYLLAERNKPVFRDLDLSKFQVVLLGEGGLVFLTADDVKKVRAFAEGGGRVVISANYFLRGTVGKANEVLDGLGLKMKDEESRGQAKDVVLGKEDFAPEVVRAKVTSLRFFRATPVTVTDKTRARVLVNAVGIGDTADGFVAAAKVGKGEVVVLGESLWWHWVSEEQSRGNDNAKLLRLLLLPAKEG